MTDKKRGRPTVKKKDEHHITGCSLPPARVCIDYRNRNRDVILAFREKYGDDQNGRGLLRHTLREGK